MIKNYFKIAWRNLWKHKFYTIINIFGLAMSIGCCIVLFQFVTYHLSFDTYHQKAKNIYKVVTALHFDDGVMMYDEGSSLAMGRALSTGLPQVKEVAEYLRMHDITVAVARPDDTSRKLFAEHENIALTDGHFFDIFDYRWEQGSKSYSLAEPNSVVLSHNTAQKYFGS